MSLFKFKTSIFPCISAFHIYLLDMPLIETSSYQRPTWLFNAHLETIYPSLFRKVSIQKPENERIQTIDQDFLDLKWYRQGSSKLVILSHGLEGSSSSSYILGMVKIFLAHQFDVLAWNFRGCGEEMNEQLTFYHSGATYDLDTVVSHAEKKYDEVYLIGFSLGGNLTLKYLGEKGNSDFKIKKGVVISAPLHLSSSSKKISEVQNFLYSHRFLTSLRKKIIQKEKEFPGKIPIDKLKSVTTLADFDDYFTGPLHGFSDAEEYYKESSSLFFLEGIKVPTLILNAQNDPFLSPACFPTHLIKTLTFVYGEFPKVGGHVGFSNPNSSLPYYSERRAVEFITDVS